MLAIDLGGTNMRAAVYAGDPSAIRLLTHEAAPTNRAAFADRLDRTEDPGRRHRGHRLCRAGARRRHDLPLDTQFALSRWARHADAVAGSAHRLSATMRRSRCLPKQAPARPRACRTRSCCRSARASARRCSPMAASLPVRVAAPVRSDGLAPTSTIAGEDRSGWLERVASGRALDRIALKLGLAAARR